MEAQIRRAKHDDLESIRLFLDQFLRKDWFMPIARVERHLAARRAEVFLAFVDESLVGIAIGGGRRKTLYNLLIHPDHRQKGIGTELLRRLDPLRIRAKTNMSTGDPTAFYHQLGYISIYRDARRTHITILERPVKENEQLTLDQLIMARQGALVDQPRLRRSTGLPPYAVLDANAYIELQNVLPPSHPLAQLHRRGLANQISLAVTPELPRELNRDSDSLRKTRQLGELVKYPEVPPVDETRLQVTVTALFGVVFPNASLGSNSYEHKLSDCRQLAYAIEANASHFITNDGDLLKKSRQIQGRFGVEVISPPDMIKVLEVQTKPLQVRSLVRPSLNIRDGTKADLNAVLSALRFAGEPLERYGYRLSIDAATWLKLTEVDGNIAAVLLAKQLTEKTAEISFLWVAPQFRRRGLGQQLLTHAINMLHDSGVEKLLTRVPVDLEFTQVFLRLFGFRAEGNAAHPDSSEQEVQMARYFLRRVITEETWDDFVLEFLESILVLRPTGQPGVWKPVTPTSLGRRQVKVETSFTEGGANIRLYDSEKDWLLEAWDTYQLESEFAPIQFELPHRYATVIPIRPRWAEALFEFPDPQMRLLHSVDKRKLRSDNVYYRAGRDDGRIRRGTPILWYVSKDPQYGFPGGIVACATAISAEIGPVDDLYYRYKDLGIYTRDQVATAAYGKGHQVQAIRFGHLTAFSRTLSVAETKAVLGAIPQTATRISFRKYLEVRKAGGLNDLEY